MGISDFFYVILFLSMIGGLACILLTFIEKVTRLSLPFPSYFSIAFFLAVPLVIPDAAIFYHEPIRAGFFNTAALVWIIGFGVFAVLVLVRTLAAHGMIKKYADCTTERVVAVYGECLENVKLKRPPPLLYGKMKEPACVITAWRSYVVLQEEITEKLTDNELRTVLTHELLHIKRTHTVLQGIFDIICCVHWFNPMVWIGRHEFSSACEVDCDRSVLKVFGAQLQAIEYAKIMMRLMELAVVKKKSLRGNLGALDFWVAKHRITNLVNAPSKLKKIIAVFACAVIVCGMIWLSVEHSRSYFYPFSGRINGIEWSESNEQH